ncbi:MAG: Gfo/Idh/MocA family oxidoreductase, partial [Clostridia bacterium]|nr:Gfo/Idh/MocA family oxidoreductase [Clostridia bacterium]
MNPVRLGVVGLGARGTFIIRTPLLPLAEMGKIEIVALCDTYEDRVEAQVKKVEETIGKKPYGTTDYRDLLTMDLDGILILSAWESHIEIACAAMEAGIQVGMEVGGVYSIEDCYRLVRTHEKTGKHCMLLENCCYGRWELMVLNMVRKGALGRISHCSGGYNHDLREEIAFGDVNRHYRQRNYLSRNCD